MWRMLRRRICRRPRARKVTGAFNIGSGTRVTINELVRLIEGASGIRPRRFDMRPPRDGDVRDSMADISAARSAPEFEPKVGLATGLAEYLTWASSRVERLTGPAPLGPTTSLAAGHRFRRRSRDDGCRHRRCGLQSRRPDVHGGAVERTLDCGSGSGHRSRDRADSGFPRSTRLVGRAGRFTTLGGRPVHLMPVSECPAAEMVDGRHCGVDRTGPLGLAASRPPSTGALPQYFDAAGAVRLAGRAIDRDENPGIGQ